MLAKLGGSLERARPFFDQLITWRELGLNMAVTRPHDYDRFESLPAWSQDTLTEHEDDPRAYIYAIGDLEASRTHCAVWNAAQTQLRTEGVMHNYLRMVWGKKILEWSPTPRAAADRMIELNNRYALDGGDPNSYSGIFWTLGRYDRPWGPERPIFGMVRYMSSLNAQRKLRMKRYLDRFGNQPELINTASRSR